MRQPSCARASARRRSAGSAALQQAQKAGDGAGLVGLRRQSKAMRLPARQRAHGYRTPKGRLGRGARGSGRAIVWTSVPRGQRRANRHSGHSRARRDRLEIKACRATAKKSLPTFPEHANASARCAMRRFLASAGLALALVSAGCSPIIEQPRLYAAAGGAGRACSIGLDTRVSVQSKIGRPGGHRHLHGRRLVLCQQPKVEHLTYHAPEVVDRRVVALIFDPNDVLAARDGVRARGRAHRSISRPRRRRPMAAS